MALSLARDIRYALRSLRRAPGFTCVAVLILALGIGANTAVFSLVSAVLLKPLPFTEPDRLMVVWDDLSANAGPARLEPTLADYVDWKQRSRSFDDLAAFTLRTYNLTGDGEPEQLTAARTTANLFSLLGLQPLLGRTFTPDDEGPDATPVVVITENLWRRRFGADPAVVGRTIMLDGLARTVIGIVPPDFRFPNNGTSIWVPASFTPEELASRQSYVNYVLGRLGAGTTPAAAQAEMTAIAETLATEHPASNTGVGVALSPLHEQLARTARPTLFVLLAAVGTVLLIACANVANLLLARGTNRRHELALRQALGADSRRVAGLLLTESGVLAVLGLIGGLLIATLSFDYLARLMPAAYPQGAAPGIDWRVLVFAGGSTLLTVLLFGAGPAFVSTRVGFGEGLRTHTGRIGIGRSGGRLSNALVVVEITMSVVLLIVAGLLLRSFAEVLAIDPGFRSEDLLIAETPLSAARYAADADRNTFYRRVLERVRRLPGVRGAGYANYSPLSFKGGRAMMSVEGQPAPTPETLTQYVSSVRTVSDGYFSALDVPLIRGRYIDERDAADAAPVAVINEAMARARWPGEDPIGRRVKFGRPDMPEAWHTVVGIVGNVRQMGLDIAPEPEIYFPLEQPPYTAPFLWPRHLVVHTDGDPLALAGAVRESVWTIDPGQPVSNPRSMTAILDGELASRDMQLTLVGGFAVLALGLAAIGLYGVLSYAVAQRRTEIGLRMALGARRGRVLGSIVVTAVSLSVLGIALGMGTAYALTRLLASFVYGVSTTDPATFAGVALLLLLVAALASYVPARRAAGVDPMAALRAD